jgi:enoyl-CoA hydratase/carnithine racemase
MSSTEFDTVIFEKRDSLASITLNRPRVLNAYNVQMRDDLWQAFQVVRDDPDIRVAVLSGAGRAFCAGADINDFGKAPSRVIARQVRWERDLWGLLLSIEKPLIVAMHGFSFGSGMEMALCCDLRLASEETIFGFPEVSLGIMPAAGGSQTLPRAIIRAKALELLLTCDRINAQEALRIGLVHRVVPPERLTEEAEELAKGLATLDQRALRLAKRAIVQGLDLSLAEGLALERDLVTLLERSRA